MALPIDTDRIAAEHTDANVLPKAHNALNKMRRSCERGTGCHLTADEIRELSLTRIGELWSQDDPRKPGGKRLSEAMLAVLDDVAHGLGTHGSAFGRSQHGGRYSTARALRSRGLLDMSNELTDAGRAALAASRPVG